MLDIFKLYPSMPKTLARPACHKYLNSRPELEDSSLIGGKQKPVSTTSVMKCLDICLDNNYFEFNDKIYHQHGGVAIGPRMSPPYACLGLGALEQKILSAENKDLDKIKIEGKITRRSRDRPQNEPSLRMHRFGSSGRENLIC